MILNLDITNASYPAKAKNRLINAPNLQVLGNANVLLNTGVAVIGSRYSSPYALGVVEAFVQEFALNGVSVISGLAPGVDCLSHVHAIKCKTPTIGVLGFGFNYLYEFENYDLVKEIIEFGGCVVSPFKSSQKPEKFTFIERNKLIAALADAVVIVEATIKSGTFYTVQSAVEFDVPVFAVPGNIFSKNSKGTHSLVKSGAYLADSPADVLETLNFDKNPL